MNKIDGLFVFVGLLIIALSLMKATGRLKIFYGHIFCENCGHQGVYLQGEEEEGETFEHPVRKFVRQDFQCKNCGHEFPRTVKVLANQPLKT